MFKRVLYGLEDHIPLGTVQTLTYIPCHLICYPSHIIFLTLGLVLLSFQEAALTTGTTLEKPSVL